jgi:hypothetical protein
VSILLIDDRRIRAWSILMVPKDHARVVLEQRAGNTCATLLLEQVSRLA